MPRLIDLLKGRTLPVRLRLSRWPENDFFELHLFVKGVAFGFFPNGAHTYYVRSGEADWELCPDQPAAPLPERPGFRKVRMYQQYTKSLDTARTRSASGLLQVDCHTSAEAAMRSDFADGYIELDVWVKE